MFSLLLAAASLTPAFGDVTQAELGHVSKVPGECAARFGGGAIEIRQAYDEAAGTMTNVAVISGKPTRALPAGTPLWVKSSYGPVWRALVTGGSAQRIEIVAHSRFVGDLVAADAPTILLHRQLSEGPGDAVIVELGDTADFRKKLAGALDCADTLGI